MTQNKQTIFLISAELSHADNVDFQKALKSLRGEPKSPFPHFIAPVLIPLVGYGEIALVHHIMGKIGCYIKDDMVYTTPDDSKRLELDLEKIKKFKDHSFLIVISEPDIPYLENLAREIQDEDGNRMVLASELLAEPRKEWFIGPLLEKTA